MPRSRRHSGNLATRLVCWVLALLLSQAALAQHAGEETAPQPGDTQLDRVIAVVNNEVILASDLEFEMRVGHLIPGGERWDSTPVRALDRLTTRALIEQQILQEDPKGMTIAPEELEASLSELRKDLPDCKLRDCTTAGGWKAYLATLGLSPGWVEAYWSHRLAVLRFIEQRFRAGIRIAPEEIKKYYEEKMLPKYANPGDAPPLERISPRIQEVLLQQQVNALLTDWLKSLQDQGQVEVLDPVLREAVAAETARQAGNGGGQ